VTGQKKYNRDGELKMGIFNTDEIKIKKNQIKERKAMENQNQDLNEKFEDVLKKGEANYNNSRTEYGKQLAEAGKLPYAEYESGVKQIKNQFYNGAVNLKKSTITELRGIVKTAEDEFKKADTNKKRLLVEEEILIATVENSAIQLLASLNGDALCGVSRHARIIGAFIELHRDNYDVLNFTKIFLLNSNIIGRGSNRNEINLLVEQIDKFLIGSTRLSIKEVTAKINSFESNTDKFPFPANRYADMTIDFN
jgi:hypothetical protein